VNVPARAIPNWTPNVWLPHIPTAPQLVFLSLSEREALYGGAAGGGKSDALLMDALAWVGHADYAGLLVRRTYRDLALSGAIMDRARAWLGPYPEVHWDNTDHRFTFPSGARLQFGYLATAADRFRYQSAEYQYIGMDEATQFEEEDYAYLLSRNRRTATSTVPGLKARLGSNPGGIGHDWVRRRFMPWVDAATGRTLYPHREDGQRRIFIPARLWDNPHVNADEYAANLRELDPVTQAQLLNGDWGVRPAGEMFDRRWFQLDGETFSPVQWVRAWDLAGTKKRPGGHDPDWSVGTLMGLTADKDIVVRDVIRERDKPGAIIDLVTQAARTDNALTGRRVMVRVEQEPGSAGKYVAEDFARRLMGEDFEAIPASGTKSLRAVPFSKAAKSGLVHLYDGPWVSDWLSEYEAFPQDSLHDDQVDSGSLAFQTLTQTPAPAGATVSSQPSGSSPYDAPRHVTGTRPRRMTG
jgi:predicted phage terminase large subunit-like protein